MKKSKRTILYNGKTYKSFSKLADDYLLPYSTFMHNLKRTNNDITLSINRTLSTIIDKDMKKLAKERFEELSNKRIEQNNEELYNQSSFNFEEYYPKSVVAYSDNGEIEEYNTKSVVESNNGEIEYSIIEPVKHCYNNRESFIVTMYPDQVDDTLSLIEKFDYTKTINLIDFENLANGESLDNLKENDINIFFYNACNFSNAFYKFIANRTTGGIYFQIITLDSLPQLVDNIIIYYLGLLTVKCPDKEIKIYSKDTAFKSLSNILNNNINIECKNLHNKNNSSDYSEKSKSEKFLYSLANYIYKLNLDINRLYSKTDIHGIIEKFYMNRSKISTIDSLNSTLTKLVQSDILKEQVVRGNIYYKFMINKIKTIAEKD